MRSVEQLQLSALHGVSKRIAAFVYGHPFLGIEGEHPLNYPVLSIPYSPFINP
ncbi:hypothetical protein D3C78_1937480 [compost metagenome]